MDFLFIGFLSSLDFVFSSLVLQFSVGFLEAGYKLVSF